MDTLGNKLGNSFFQLNSQFHHIIWMGDMNFRMSGLEIEDASAQLQAGKFEELHAANGARAPPMPTRRPHAARLTVAVAA